MKLYPEAKGLTAVVGSWELKPHRLVVVLLKKR
jgi:hypothetical protein